MSLNRESGWENKNDLSLIFINQGTLQVSSYTDPSRNVWYSNMLYCVCLKTACVWERVVGIGNNARPIASPSPQLEVVAFSSTTRLHNLHPKKIWMVWPCFRVITLSCPLTENRKWYDSPNFMDCKPRECETMTFTPRDNHWFEILYFTWNIRSLNTPADNKKWLGCFYLGKPSFEKPELLPGTREKIYNLAWCRSVAQAAEKVNQSFASPSVPSPAYTYNTCIKYLEDYLAEQ